MLTAPARWGEKSKNVCMNNITRQKEEITCSHPPPSTRELHKSVGKVGNKF